jgi:hypothetical protein
LDRISQGGLDPRIIRIEVLRRVQLFETLAPFAEAQKCNSVIRSHPGMLPVQGNGLFIELERVRQFPGLLQFCGLVVQPYSGESILTVTITLPDDLAELAPGLGRFVGAA